MDFGKGPSFTRQYVYVTGLGGGKTEMARNAVKEFLRRNPGAKVIYARPAP